MTERHQKSAKVSSVEAVVASNVGVVGRMELAEQIGKSVIIIIIMSYLIA